MGLKRNLAKLGAIRRSREIGGDLDDEFRCTRDIALFDMTPTATFGQHA